MKKFLALLLAAIMLIAMVSCGNTPDEGETEEFENEEQQKEEKNIKDKTVLDMGGAEKLLDKGDALYAPSGSPKPQQWLRKSASPAAPSLPAW